MNDAVFDPLSAQMMDETRYRRPAVYLGNDPSQRFCDGDTIMAVNRKSVSNYREYMIEYAQARRGSFVEFQVLRETLPEVVESDNEIEDEEAGNAGHAGDVDEHEVEEFSNVISGCASQQV